MARAKRRTFDYHRATGKQTARCADSQCSARVRPSLQPQSPALVKVAGEHDGMAAHLAVLDELGDAVAFALVDFHEDALAAVGTTN